MSEITNENFVRMLAKVKDSIKRSTFIAIDTELTGLVCDQSCTPSLFDTIEERYEKQRQSVSKFMVCQIGLSLYSKDNNSNIYRPTTYTFYLCPRSLSNRLDSFQIDLSAIEFLAYNQFSFDKFAKNGITFMNETEEQNLRENFDKYVNEIDFIECPLNYEVSSQHLSDWISSRLVNNNCGNQLILKSRPTVNPLVNYAFLKEFRKNFTSVWVQQINDRFVAKPVDLKQRSDLMKDEEREKESVINQMIGFSSVFKSLVEAKRPIVGHNMIMDLLHIYHRFYKPLPKRLKDFKSSLHSIFPFIFDTKCIIFNERQNLIELSHIIKNTSLGDMYLKLLDDEIVNSFTNSPQIEQIKDEDHFANKEFLPHNAGFDAFITGFVFIKIGFILMVKNDNNSNELTHNWFEFLKSIEKNCNKVNLIRANTHYMCISEAADPSANRTKQSEWLLARKRTKDSDFSVTKLTSKLSTIGMTDIKLVNTDSILIAVNSRGMYVSFDSISL